MADEQAKPKTVTLHALRGFVMVIPNEDPAKEATKVTLKNGENPDIDRAGYERWRDKYPDLLGYVQAHYDDEAKPEEA